VSAGLTTQHPLSAKVCTNFDGKPGRSVDTVRSRTQAERMKDAENDLQVLKLKRQKENSKWHKNLIGLYNQGVSNEM
jgi:hypothetical protein